jgi:hypothetical protein
MSALTISCKASPEEDRQTVACRNPHCPHPVQFLTKNKKCRVCGEPFKIQSSVASYTSSFLAAWMLALGFSPDDKHPFRPAPR